MPIFDQGYQHWQGQLSGHGWRWLAIARRGVRTQLKNRWTRVAMILAWLPALVLGGFLTLWGLFEQKPSDWAGFFGFFPQAVLLNPTSFRSEAWAIAFSIFLSAETYAAMILVVIVGPNLISQDMRFNAMPLYLSRPVTRLDYFVGKLATIGTFLAAVMIVPAILSYVIGVAFSLNYRVFSDTYWIIPACLAYAAIVVLVAGLFMLAISAMSKNSLYVAAIWIGLWMVGWASSLILSNPNGLNLKWGPIVSLTDNFDRMRGGLLGGEAAFGRMQRETLALPGMAGMRNFFGSKGPPNPFAWDYPWQWSAYVLLGIVGLSLCILTTRVKSLDRLR